MSNDSGSAGSRSRTGLAKLRGEAALDAPPDTPIVSAGVPAPALPPAEAQRAPVAAAEASPVVTLEKPEAAVPSPATDAQQQQRGSRGLVTSAIALIVAAAVLLVFVIALSGRLGNDTKKSAAATQGTPDERLVAVRAARQFAVSFFTYDYRKINDYFTRIQASSTGNFRADFVSKEKTLKTVVTQLKTVATGQVPDAGAGLYTISGDKATALVAVNLRASNAVTKNGEKRYRVKIAMQRIKGAWQVTDFEEVV